MRRKQTDLSFKTAGAPSRLQGPPPPTRAPILEKLGSDGTTERVKDLQGRTDVVHKHFKELSTDPLHKETPEWIWQRWPCEVLRSLPTLDGQRVKAAYAFRKRTSCADDHLVIEMLRELDEDTWETLVQTAEPLDGRSGHAVGKTGGYENGKLHNERLPPNCHATNDVPVVLKSVATVGGSGNPHQVPGREAHEVVFILRRIVEQANEWRIPIFVMDCDVAAAFDHVSHH